MIKKMILLEMSFFDFFHKRKNKKFLKNNNLVNNVHSKINNFVQIYKSKMSFRKIFECIYQKREL